MGIRENYHGWLIELLPQLGGYSFQCWTAAGRIGVSDHQIYPTAALALTVARKRADLEAVCWSLTRFLNEACLRYKLNLEESIALENSVLDFATATCKEYQAMLNLSEMPDLQAQCEILCAYKNETPSIQIIRIANIPGWYFERVVFPDSQLLFEALPEAELEVHTGTALGAILTDKIRCSNLRVQELSTREN